nr:PREDICTED: probable 5-formyltetrahydrofolate cyclo-ligase isoform X2 [Bemisia tabaci]
MDRKAMRMLIAMQTEANTQEQKDQESKEIREKLFEMQRYKDSLRVGTYLSRPEQVDTIEIVKKMVQENKKVFIPKQITNDDIDMVLYDGKTDLNELHLNTSAFKPPDVCDPQQSALETAQSGRISTERLRIMAELDCKLEKMSKVEKFFENQSIRKQFFELPQYPAADRIGIYLSRPDQPDTIEIFKEMLKDGKHVFIPWVTTERDLELVSTRGLSDLDLPLNRYGFRQPNRTMDQQEAIKTGGLDIIVIPGKAFTKSGQRMGTWQGWYYPYVRTLKVYKRNLTVVAFAWRHQIVDFIPDFSHPEIKVDALLYYHKKE